MNSVTPLNVRKGQIYTYDFGKNPGSVQNGLRPVLVVQADNINKLSGTVIVAAITSRIKKTRLPSHVVLPDNTGLDVPSMVILEQIRVIDKSELRDYCGQVEEVDTLRDIHYGLKYVFDIWKAPDFAPKDVMTLCDKCVSFYKGKGNYKVRRYSPNGNEVGQCVICGYFKGFDYIVTDKSSRKAYQNRRPGL